MSETQDFSKKPQKKQKPRQPLTWDNVYGLAAQEYDCAWKCRKCGRLHVQHGRLDCKHTWHKATREYGEKMIRDQLEMLLREINQGRLHPLDISGVCEKCGHAQPWGAEAYGRILPRRTDTVDIWLAIGMAFAILAAVFWFAFPTAFATEETRLLWIWLYVLGEAFFVWAAVACWKGMKRIKSMRTEAEHMLRKTEQTMKANHEAGCFPLLRTGNDYDWMPGDERKAALMEHKEVYAPYISVRCDDDD